MVGIFHPANVAGKIMYSLPRNLLVKDCFGEAPRHFRVRLRKPTGGIGVNIGYMVKYSGLFLQAGITKKENGTKTPTTYVNETRATGTRLEF